MGFTYFNTKPVKVVPTTQEILASLSGAQKGKILNAFARGTKAKIFAYKEGLQFQVVNHLFKKIDAIQKSSKEYMRGEVLITPAVIDLETGEVTTLAVFNTPPVNASELLSTVQDAFSDDFSTGQITAILTKMVEYSKFHGDGDWAFYAAEIIK